MSSVSKTSGSKFTIIRRPDYARKDVEPVVEVEISNKDSKLDNQAFNDLIFHDEKKEQKKKKPQEQHSHLKEEQKKDGTTKNKDGLTDFYV